MIKNSKKLFQKYKDKIIDIVLFGSLAKNKINPNDIDIAIILKNTKESEMLDLMKNFGTFFDNKTHLNILLIETIFANSLFITLLSEGISLIDNKQLYEKLNYDSGTIYSLDISKMKKNKKVLFSYALHGNKNQKGILTKINGKLIGRLVVFIPVKFTDDFKDFLELWGVDYYRMDVLKK